MFSYTWTYSVKVKIKVVSSLIVKVKIKVVSSLIVFSDYAHWRFTRVKIHNPYGNNNKVISQPPGSVEHTGLFAHRKTRQAL